MSYDHWKQTPPAEALSVQDEQEPEASVCRDCRIDITEGAKSMPYGTSCDECWRVRALLGVEFDSRVLPQIEAALRRKAG